MKSTPSSSTVIVLLLIGAVAVLAVKGEKAQEALIQLSYMAAGGYFARKMPEV